MSVVTTEQSATNPGEFYSRLSLYIKQVELVDVAGVHQALTLYLKSFLADFAGEYIDTIKAHVNQPFSWLAKASILIQMQQYIDECKERLASNVASATAVHLQDAIRKLKYIIDKSDEKVFQNIVDIRHGIDAFINQDMKLEDVRGEISDFLKEIGVNAQPLANDTVTYGMKLSKLLKSSLVNSIKALKKAARTLSIQSDLYLNRFDGQINKTEVAEDVRWGEKISSAQSLVELQALEANLTASAKAEENSNNDAVVQQFHANNFVVKAFAQQYVDMQGQINDQFTDQVVGRLWRGSEQAQNLSNVAHRFEEYSVKYSQQLTGSIQSNVSTAVFQNLIAEKRIVLNKRQEQEQAHEVSRQINELESSIVRAENLSLSVTDKIKLYKVQIACAAKVKQCYGKFSLFILFRKISANLQAYRADLVVCVQALEKPTNWQAASLDNNQVSQFEQMQNKAVSELRANIQVIDDYLQTLDIHNPDYDLSKPIQDWQEDLNELVATKDQEQLVVMEQQLDKINRISSAHLRAVLIMRFKDASPKFTKMILSNMASWSNRFVERDVVWNTLKYLGVDLSEKSFDRISIGRVRRAHEENNPRKNIFVEMLSDMGDMACTAQAWIVQVSQGVFQRDSH
jgi:hypothetical protein